MFLFKITELFINLLMCTNRKIPNKLNFTWDISSHSPQTFQAPSQGLGEKHQLLLSCSRQDWQQRGSISHCSIFLKPIHTPAHTLTSTVTSHILLSAGQYICVLNSPGIWEVNLFSHFWIYWSYFMFGEHVGRIWCTCSLITVGKGSGSYFSFK